MLSPTERYYVRQCEDAIARKPIDVDLDEMNPFIANDSELAQSIWLEAIEKLCPEGVGILVRPGNNHRAVYSNAERLAILKKIKDLKLNRTTTAQLAGVSRHTLNNLKSGKPMSVFTMKRLRAFMERYSNAAPIERPDPGYDYKKLNAWMIDKNISNTKLAKMLHCSSGTIANVRSGDYSHTPFVDKIMAFIERES
jgi:DNA-binding Xre family transcriptional regulator